VERTSPRNAFFGLKISSVRRKRGCRWLLAETANVERVGPDRVGFFYRGMSRSNQGLFVENHSRNYLPIQTTSVRDWIRAVASFRMGISVSEVAFGDVIFPKTARRRLKCPYDSRREARSVKPVSDYLARFERRRCLFRDGMWCYIIA
jgi:hypothetical protein